MNTSKWIALIVGILIIPLTIRMAIVYPEQAAIEILGGVAGVAICVYVLFKKPTNL